MPSIRFASVVDKAGAPEMHFRFGPAAKDKALQQALKENRVMTVHREPRGQRKDFGTIGYHEDEHAQILIFPRSLAKFADRRVVAVNFDLVQDEKLESNPDAPPVEWKPRPRKGRPKPTEPEPKPSKSAPPEKKEPPEKPAPPSLEKVLREVRLAANELKRGKSVAAYERLQSLL